MTDPLKTAAERKSRSVYVYDVPEGVGEGITSIGIVQLSTHDEMMAAKRAGGDPIKLAYEQVKQGLVEVNGQPVKLADGSVEVAFDKMGPKVRNLVMTAHARLHAPEEDVVEGFLKSRTVKVT